jgi:hypothetical protein
MTFEETKRLLEAHGLRTLVLLQPEGEGCLLIAPDLSGKLMAVSVDGPKGENFGFVNEKAISNRGKDPQFNAYGGALRWWIGPEGGQYGVAFPPGTKEFNLSSWYISEEYNGKPFEIAYPKESEGIAALMGAECRIQNASGTRFHIGVSCRISLIDTPYARGLGDNPPPRQGLKSAARNSGAVPILQIQKTDSVNRGRPLRKLSHLGYLCETAFQNLSDEPMRKETGLLSIWLLGMYLPSAETSVIIPFEKNGSGRIVTDTYFSPDGLTSDRLLINKKAGYLLFRADGKERSKIGISRARASTTIGNMRAHGGAPLQHPDASSSVRAHGGAPLHLSRAGASTALASIDFLRNLLTLWRFPVQRRMPYVNSLWEWQKRPYSGDVINSYNDDGKIGNFYELECSSPALALAPGERASFPLEIHHFSGSHDALFAAACRLLNRRMHKKAEFLWDK